MRIGAALVALPALLLVATWQTSGSIPAAAAIASWPAFLMWPVGALLVVAGSAERLIRSVDDSIRNRRAGRDVDPRGGAGQDGRD